MKFNERYFPIWLNQVREKLLSLSVAGKSCRIFLLKPDLVLDEDSWRSYFNDGYMPWQAIHEDLEIPWIEYKAHRVL